MATSSALPQGGGQQGSGEAANALAVRTRLKALFEAVHSGDIQRFISAANAEGGSVAETTSVRDARGRGVLHHAAQLGHIDLAKYLIDELGADVNLQDESGETPLAMAASGGSLPMVRLLLAHGAKVDLRRGNDGAAPIHRAAGGPSVEVLEALVDASANVSTPSETGPPLCWAAGSGQLANVECLLRHGADANAMTPEDVSPLLMAAATGSVAVVKAILAGGADPSQVCQDGATALLAAAAFPNADAGLQIVDALLQAGADANLADDGGATALLAAGAEGHLKIVERLLPCTTPIEGVEWTALAVAEYARKQWRGDDPSGSDQADVEEDTGDGPANIPDAEEPDEPAAQVAKRQGDEAFVKGDFSAANEAYTRSLRHATGNHLVWANRSAALLRLGRALAALQDARVARTLRPEYGKAWYREGSAHAALERWEDAAHAYYAGCRVDPENVEMVKAFREAIAKGQAEHAAKQLAAQKG